MFWITIFLFSFLWIYKGLPFWKALLAFFIVNIIFNSFIRLGFLQGFWISLIIALSLWVYGNAKTFRVRFGWFYALVTFIFPFIGLPIYLIIRTLNYKLKTETVNFKDGKMEIFK
jgi:hypothetical protein